MIFAQLLYKLVYAYILMKTLKNILDKKQF